MVRSLLAGAEVLQEPSVPSSGSGPEGGGWGVSAPFASQLMEPLLENTGCACQGHRGLSQQPLQVCSVQRGRSGDSGGWGPRRGLRPGLRAGEQGDSAPASTPSWVSAGREALV